MSELIAFFKFVVLLSLRVYWFVVSVIAFLKFVVLLSLRVYSFGSCVYWYALDCSCPT